MGYRGKLAQQEQARAMRATGATLVDIATALGVSKSSASLWTRDVRFVPSPRRTGPRRRPGALERQKAQEIKAALIEGTRRIGTLGEREFLVAGAALYAGEGAKRDGCVAFANSNPQMVAFFCAWLRTFFEVDESRLRVRLYLHQGLDADAAQSFWSVVTRVPVSQFRTPYRAVPDPSIRTSKHEHGCVSVIYSCSRTHRAIMGLVEALLGPSAIPG